MADSSNPSTPVQAGEEETIVVAPAMPAGDVKPVTSTAPAAVTSETKKEDPTKNSKASGKPNKHEMVPYKRLFRYATTLDMALLYIGSFFAALNGVIFPVSPPKYLGSEVSGVWKLRPIRWSGLAGRLPWPFWPPLTRRSIAGFTHLQCFTLIFGQLLNVFNSSNFADEVRLCALRLSYVKCA